MPAWQAAGVCQHQLPADRADARGHLDGLRRWPGPRMAADHSHGLALEFRALGGEWRTPAAVGANGRRNRTPHANKWLLTKTSLAGLPAGLAVCRTVGPSSAGAVSRTGHRVSRLDLVALDVSERG